MPTFAKTQPISRTPLLPCTATALNARGQITDFKLGELNATYTYNAVGEIERQQVGTIQDMSYDFDYKGNLQYRWDRISNQKEVFGYDELDRLSSVDYYKNDVNLIGGRLYLSDKVWL